jgi:hypothetical protein
VVAVKLPFKLSNFWLSSGVDSISLIAKCGFSGIETKHQKFVLTEKGFLVKHRLVSL